MSCEEKFKAQSKKNRGEVPIQTSPLRRGFSYCGSACGSKISRKNEPPQKVPKQRKIPPKSTDSRGILELLGRFELPTSSLPIIPRPFYGVSIRVAKYPQVLATQGLKVYFVFSCVLSYCPVCWKICWKVDLECSRTPVTLWSCRKYW